MLPESAATLTVFLLLVIPGVLFELVAARRRPESERTVFRETSVVALTSVVFSGAALVVLSMVRSKNPSWMPDPGAWFRDADYAAGHYRLIARAAVAEVVLASGLAWLGARFMGKGHIRPTTNWYAVFRDSAPPNSNVRAVVETTDGTTYRGFIGGYTADDVPPDERELVLIPPLYVRRRGGDETAIDWDRILLTGSQIASITVAYISSPTPAFVPTRWRLRSPLVRVPS